MQMAAFLGFAGGAMLTVSLAVLVPGVLGIYLDSLGAVGACGALVSLLAMGMLLAALLERCLPKEKPLALAGGFAGAVGALLASALFRGLLTPGFWNGGRALAAGAVIWVGGARLLPAGFGFGHGRAASLGFALGVLFVLAGIAALA